MPTAELSPHSAKVKFRLAGNAQPLILVPVHVNERGPFDFILDTGAGTSLLAIELAKKLEVKILGSKEGQSAGGAVAVSLAKVDSFAVGEAKIDDVDVGIVDLAHIGRTIGAKIDGDLGYNFLKNFRLTIDYANCEIGFDDSKLGKGSLKAEVSLRLASPAKPLLLVDVHANGRGPFQFAIDTGTSMTAITPELAKKLGVSSPPAGTLKSFQIGGAKIDNSAVVVADFFAMLSNAVGAKLDGIVGYNFLRNYKLVIDYPAEALSLFSA